MIFYFDYLDNILLCLKMRSSGAGGWS